MIGYDSPILAILFRVISRKKIAYFAILPVYERLIISRKLAGRWSPKRAYYWLIDFLAFFSSDLIMLETNHQIDFVNNFYFIPKERLFRSWTGVDGELFFYEPAITKASKFTILFRGAFLPEAGVEYVIRAAKILENKDVNFIVIGGGMLLNKTKKLIDELKPSNLKLITDFLPHKQLRRIMQGCHLSLGQLSDHNRLTRTIPHKTFESLAMKLPYLTASNSGILELLTSDKTCLVCNPADAQSLADKILWAKNNYSIAEEIAENGYRLYQSELESNLLAKKLIDKLQTLL